MKKIKNILFPTDFSENSINALPFAIDLLKKTNGELSLLNVPDVKLLTPVYAYSGQETTIAGVNKNIHKKSLHKLKIIVQENELTKYAHRYFVRNGTVQNEIHQLINEQNIDLVVMGTKGATAERGLFVGSITYHIIQNSNCPVIAIPEDAKFEDIHKIVYATDLRLDETKAIRFLVRLARLYNATLVILHIDTKDKNREESIERLKNIVDKSTYPKIAYKQFLELDILEGIENYLQNQKSDVLAMTTNTTTLLDKIIHKSLSKQMLLHTHIPLLVFNRKKQDVIFIG